MMPQIVCLAVLAVAIISTIGATVTAGWQTAWDDMTFVWIQGSVVYLVNQHIASLLKVTERLVWVLAQCLLTAVDVYEGDTTFKDFDSN